MRAMVWRLIALAATLVVVGSLLVTSPIEQGAVRSDRLNSGQWIDVPVPAATSWTGSSVDVLLSWGAVDAPVCAGAAGCPAHSPSPSPQYEPTFLLVFDCGGSPCAANQNYTLVGSSDVATGGSAGFVATPSHHYQVWLLVPVNSSPQTLVPVRFALNTPLFGGYLGAGAVAGGIAAGLVAVVQGQRERRGRPSAKAFL
jgi:hypothetical protein